MGKHFGNIKDIGGTITGTGATVKDIAQTSHGFSTGQVLKFTGSAYALAQADSAANAEVVGIVCRVYGANNFALLVEGYLTGLAGLTAGTTYFLSPTNPGVLTSTEPTTPGQISVPLFVADSNGAGYFHKFRPKTQGVLSISEGGTGQSTASAAINGLIPSQSGNADKILTTNGSAVSWGQLTTNTPTNLSGYIVGASGTLTSVTHVSDTDISWILPGANKFFVSTASTPTWRVITTTDLPATYSGVILGANRVETTETCTNTTTTPTSLATVQTISFTLDQTRTIGVRYAAVAGNSIGIVAAGRLGLLFDGVSNTGNIVRGTCDVNFAVPLSGEYFIALAAGSHSVTLVFSCGQSGVTFERRSIVAYVL